MGLQAIRCRLMTYSDSLPREHGAYHHPPQDGCRLQEEQRRNQRLQRVCVRVLEENHQLRQRIRNLEAAR